jgi:ABC-type transport system substrate-binding protein
LEPGTATDYTYLLTQHIAGAADYVQFRHDGVALLTALGRLQEGKRITASEARQLAPAIDWPRQPPPPQTASEIEWDAFARIIQQEPRDWNAEYEQFFEEHVAHTDAVFRSVGLDTPDDQTLIVHLSRLCPYFLDLAAFPIFLPIHKGIEQVRLRSRGAPITAEGLVVYDPQWTKPDYAAFGYPGLITNGPYVVHEWSFKRRLTLQVNPYYRDSTSIDCRAIDMLVYENPNAAIMAYESGDVDFLPSMVVSYDHELARLACPVGRKARLQIMPGDGHSVPDFQLRE